MKRRIDPHGVEAGLGSARVLRNGVEDLRAYPNETPRHTVCLDRGFWMDRYEITNANFLEFAAAGGFQDRRHWSDEGWRAHEGFRSPFRGVEGYTDPRQPCVKITWYETEAYARWRGGRVPTEAEWEWAARGPQSQRYPWGQDFRDGLAHTDRNGLRRTVPGGGYPKGASWCGVEDMAGNVWEWTADGYEAAAYRTARLNGPFYGYGYSSCDP